MSKAIVRNVGDGERRWFLGGGTHIWKATSDESNGTLAVFEVEMVCGKVTPMHYHADFEESLYIIDGEILLNIDGAECMLGTGGFTFMPRNLEHAFMVTSESARLLSILTPASGHDFYWNASLPAGTSGTGPVDFDRLGEIAIETGATTIVGPPPFALSK